MHLCNADLYSGTGRNSHMPIALPLDFLRAATLADDFAGRKPQKVKHSADRPDADRAAKTADGPGTGTTLKFCATTAFTRRAPGSLMRGVPAKFRNLQMQAWLLQPLYPLTTDWKEVLLV